MSLPSVQATGTVHALVRRCPKQAARTGEWRRPHPPLSPRQRWRGLAGTALTPPWGQAGEHAGSKPPVRNTTGLHTASREDARHPVQGLDPSFRALLSACCRPPCYGGLLCAPPDAMTTSGRNRIWLCAASERVRCRHAAAKRTNRPTNYCVLSLQGLPFPARRKHRISTTTATSKVPRIWQTLTILLCRIKSV